MLRALSFVCALSLAACVTSGGDGPTSMATVTASDGGAMVEIEVSYTPIDDDSVRIRFALRPIGMDEMDKLALNVVPGDFNVVEGSVQWSGYVAPRETQVHELVLERREDTDPLRASFTLVRFADSGVLAGQDLEFTAGPKGLTALSR